MTNAAERPTVNVTGAVGRRAARAGRPHRRRRRPCWTCDDVSVFYGNYEAVRGTTMAIAQEPDHRDDRPVRLRQVDHSAVA